MQKFYLSIFSIVYRCLIKPLFFLISPEIVHNRMIRNGEILGKSVIARKIISAGFQRPHPAISQVLHGISFQNPIGLAAGFDSDAHITQILPSLGFGFGTVGTVTNKPYAGNPAPRMGRLPKSQSLMVNKGFKSEGAIHISKRLKAQTFSIPIGISIGRSNTQTLSNEKESIRDILAAFEKFEEAGVSNAYYELNISCPNLSGNVSFYPAKNLHDLLKNIDSLGLVKPIFIKMPIEVSNKGVLAMLDIIAKHKIAGVIIGNLQKNRSDPSFHKEELQKFPIGNFSGRPTWERSNELISLTYRNFGDRMTIIGCGGVFSSEDAYKKILFGSSLIQLITGMIYKGPQLIAQINNELPEFLLRDGFKTISDARGRGLST